MNTTGKIIIIVSLWVSVFSTMLFPYTARAQAIDYGGYLFAPLPCTCSGGVLLYMFDKKTFRIIPMVFQFGASSLKQSYNIYTPLVQTLGDYIPGAGVCLVVATPCVTIPAEGMISPFPFQGTGTSLIPG